MTECRKVKDSELNESRDLQNFIPLCTT